LFSTDRNGKPVWERIIDEEFTSAPALKGWLYDEMPVKIMYVDHAVNGRVIDPSTCLSFEKTVDSLPLQKSIVLLRKLHIKCNNHSMEYWIFN